MAKKIKRRPDNSGPVVDTELEEVGEERAFELELDEETKEVIFVHHYRRVWGDTFDADVEHGLNMEEAMEVVNVMLNMIEVVKKKTIKEKVLEFSEEKNPMRDNPVQ